MREHFPSAVTRGNGIRTWAHGEFPIPAWVPQYMARGIEPNGTFELDTQRGNVRVHPGDAVIERCGTIWVCPVEETPHFIERLESTAESTIPNIGPGKAHLYGSGDNASRKPKSKTGKAADRRMRFLPPVGSQPSIEWIHLNRLTVDSCYQRSIDNAASRRLITSIATKFDWRLCAPLVVSRRADDTLTIIDGQHRWMAACRREDIPQLPCCVFRYENTKEEARMFIIANRARKPINRLDDYFAALAASDEDALEIQTLVTQAGLRIARSTSSVAWAPGELAFTSAIAHSIRRFGTAITLAALTNIAVAFPGQKLTHGGAIFGALVRIMSRDTTDLDPDQLMSTLQVRTCDEWGMCAAGLNGGDRRADALRAAIMKIYEGVPTATVA